MRVISVYVPPHRPGEELAVVYLLAPWTSAGRTLLDWRPFKESVPERMERLFEDEGLPPCLVVSPDLFTGFGGSQFIDSDYFGPHGRFIVDEVVPFVEDNFPVRKGAAHRGVFGRSSGGFGALRLALDHPGVFAAVAAHSADLGFDLVYYGDLVTICKKLARFSGDVEGLLKQLGSADKLSGGDIHLLMLLGCCGFFSPNPKSALGYDLPVDWYSGKVDQRVWQRWLGHDPLNVIEKKTDALRTLKFLYVECGLHDQFNLLYGARQFHAKLEQLNIEHQYEEFDDNHSGTEYRFDKSLPAMIRALV